MALFGRTGDKLAAGPTLVLAADPGPALLDTARRYDPERLKVAEAALALAARAGGIAIDMFGFRFATPQVLLAAGEGAPEP